MMATAWLYILTEFCKLFSRSLFLCRRRRPLCRRRRCSCDRRAKEAKPLQSACERGERTTFSSRPYPPVSRLLVHVLSFLSPHSLLIGMFFLFFMVKREGIETWSHKVEGKAMRSLMEQSADDMLSSGYGQLVGRMGVCERQRRLTVLS